MPLSAGAIRQADRRARKRYTYRRDGPIDVWRSHADAVERGEAWADDCDGLASTVLDLLCRAGLALEDGYRLAMSTIGAVGANHMVGCVRDSGGHYWIVGDTFDRCYPVARCRHRALEYNRLSERWPGGEALWRDGAPFARSEDSR